jgi:chromosome segregation ATPase
LSKLNKVDKKVAKTKYENNFDRANTVDNKIDFLQAKADELQLAISRMEDLLKQKREIYKELRSHKTKKEIREKSHLISYEKRVNNLAEQQGKVTLNLYNLQNDIKKV